MRIHTSAGVDTLHLARSTAGVSLRFMEHGSRTHARAFEVKLTGSSSRRPNSGTRGAGGGDDYAATWDEWGMLLAVVFEADPAARVARVYADAADFRRRTGGRFESLTPAEQHRNHRWIYTGTPHTHECECGATQTA